MPGGAWDGGWEIDVMVKVLAKSAHSDVLLVAAVPGHLCHPKVDAAASSGSVPGEGLPGALKAGPDLMALGSSWEETPWELSLRLL